MPDDGEIREFELFAGAENRGLRIGIYRPTGNECEFTLIQQKEWPTFDSGYNKVLLILLFTYLSLNKDFLNI